VTPSFVRPAVVELDGVGKSFGAGATAVRALQDASLSIGPGEVVALVGRSGSGKTTLLNVLLGWEAPDHGSVSWDGGTSSPSTLPWDAIGVLPQSLALIEELSVLDNVRLPQTLAPPGAQDSRPVEDLMSQLGIDHLASRRPLQTSLGEQQRTALARAVVLAPRLLIADEPTSHQDAQHAAGIFELLRQLALEGGSCLVATHNEDAARYCDRVLAIEGGRVRSSSEGATQTR
jgi:ABC-type lipoprotein export system ATPase subunit